MKKKILIVEDDETLLKLEANLLSLKGYAVTEVMDGPSALESVSNIKPDLIILDVMLPCIDGYEVCRQIKSNEETRHIPIVMLSANNSNEDISKGEQSGADVYITKPFMSVGLIENIQRFLS